MNSALQALQTRKPLMVSKPEQRDAAKELYLLMPVARFNVIARKVGTNRQQVAAWAREGRWPELRDARQEAIRQGATQGIRLSTDVLREHLEIIDNLRKSLADAVSTRGRQMSPADMLAALKASGELWEARLGLVRQLETLAAGDVLRAELGSAFDPKLTEVQE